MNSRTAERAPAELIVMKLLQLVSTQIYINCPFKGRYARFYSHFYCGFSGYNNSKNLAEKRIYISCVTLDVFFFVGFVVCRCGSTDKR